MFEFVRAVAPRELTSRSWPLWRERRKERETRKEKDERETRKEREARRKERRAVVFNKKKKCFLDPSY